MVQPPGLHMRSQSRRPTMVLYSTFECTMKGIWSMSTYGEPWSPTVQKFHKSLSIGQKSVTDWQQLSEEGREEIWGAQVSTKFTLNFFKNWPFAASFFFIFVLTKDLWCRKWPLYQLSHNHCPLNNLDFVWINNLKRRKQSKWSQRRPKVFICKNIILIPFFCWLGSNWRHLMLEATALLSWLIMGGAMV